MHLSKSKCLLSFRTLIVRYVNKSNSMKYIDNFCEINVVPIIKTVRLLIHFSFPPSSPRSLPFISHELHENVFHIKFLSVVLCLGHDRDARNKILKGSIHYRNIKEEKGGKKTTIKSRCFLVSSSLARCEIFRSLLRSDIE